jgi:hypothetical protein
MPGLFGRDHDRRAMRVVGADEVHLVAAHALEPHPDVGLDVLHDVADVEGAVGVGQGGGDEQLARHGAGAFRRWLEAVEAVDFSQRVAAGAPGRAMAASSPAPGTGTPQFARLRSPNHGAPSWPATEQALMAALAGVIDPNTGQDLRRRPRQLRNLASERAAMSAFDVELGYPAKQPDSRDSARR